MSGAAGWVLWALVGLPLAGGALLALAGRAADRVAAPLAVGTAGLVTGLAALAAVGRPRVEAPLLAGLPVRLAVDGLSAFLVVTVAAVTWLILGFCAGEFARDAARARFFGLMLLFSGAMMTTVTAVSLPVLLMAWEVMGAASWALIGYWWHDPDRVRAADTAFLTTRAADLGLYLAAGAAFAGAPTASLALADLPAAAEPWRSLATAGVVLAALGKSAQLPFSFWLSHAMRGPAPVSALLHSATMVAAGGYLLLRAGPLLDASGWGGPLVAWTGAATAVALGLVALAQTDLKQLLAASSCAQVGLLVLAAGVGSRAGGVLQLMSHAAAKSLAFLVAGAWLAALGGQALSGLRGAARRGPPGTGVAFTVALAALAGLPPLALWAAKDVLLAAALADSPWLYAAGLVATALAAGYGARALWFVWRDAGGATVGRLSRPAGATLALLTLACLGLTFAALPPLGGKVATVLGGPEAGAVRGWEWVVSGAVAVAGASAAWAWGDRAPPVPAGARRRLVDWLGLERVARAVLVAPVVRLADALARFDDLVLHRAVTGAARATGRLALATERVGERRLFGAAVAGVAAGCAGLGRLARRPQTGLLHHYLAQAVAVLAAAAVVLLLVR
ncbi:NADH-quinone oxidoreductase subunit L [Streptomyces sp. NPDC127098]|uniref:NADH-quinone oxidoreductase subunit 5 family protein n=1 Tax=Streptomyces sp. NPDC127098 TaxID=3347137 RepID=UPI0036583CFD